MVAGMAHYLHRWTADGQATTRCGVLTRPHMSDFREPDPRKREHECRRCTDWKEIP
jgi:hypothetical protein